MESAKKINVKIAGKEEYHSKRYVRLSLTQVIHHQLLQSAKI